MHAGNIFASLVSWLVAKSSSAGSCKVGCNNAGSSDVRHGNAGCNNANNSNAGRVVLRIDNLDDARSKQKYIDYVMRDYKLLGITWDAGPYYQSDNTSSYELAFKKLQNLGLVYPCFCSRKKMQAADPNASQAPHKLYKTNKCSCCNLSVDEQMSYTEKLKQEGRRPCYRVSVAKLFDYLHATHGAKQQSCHQMFYDMFKGAQSYNLLQDYSDFIVKRSDGAYAYQLAVVIDDATEGINTVVRGCDLLSSTPLQIALANVLGVPRINYAHVPLICAPDGRRLAKRNSDAYLDELLKKYRTPESIIGHIAYVTGITNTPDPTTPTQLLEIFNLSKMKQKWGSVEKIIQHQGNPPKSLAHRKCLT